jgi:hypothetical protein
MPQLETKFLDRCGDLPQILAANGNVYIFCQATRVRLDIFDVEVRRQAPTTRYSIPAEDYAASIRPARSKSWFARFS